MSCSLLDELKQLLDEHGVYHALSKLQLLRGVDLEANSEEKLNGSPIKDKNGDSSSDHVDDIESYADQLAQVSYDNREPSVSGTSPKSSNKPIQTFVHVK